MKNMARDVLIFWAAVVFLCGTAWAFWHYLGTEAGALVLLAGTFISLFVENHKLRRRLTELGHPPRWRR